MSTVSRRELLQRAASMTGIVIATPVLASVLDGCAQAAAETWKPQTLTSGQFDVVADIAELMMPRTEIAGAKDVGVPRFIDLMLKEAYTNSDRERFIVGCDAFNARARAEHGKSFTKIASTQQLALVKRSMNAALTAAATPEATFVMMTKELTLLGYLTSEVGVTRLLQYDPVPGAYHACVPLTKAGEGRAWALDGLFVL